jgi:anaerobic magnesium-protoporphyrin IX monomethyl ester cyclase
VSDYDLTLVNVSLPVVSETDKKTDTYLPLGCLYLVSALEQAGYRVDFRDYQLGCAGKGASLDLDAFVAFLDGAAPVVGISSMVSMLPFVLLGTKRYKQAHPASKIILGGPGPSGVAAPIMEAMPWIDVVARGEGEATAVELLRVLREGGDLASVAGITYRSDGGVHETPARPRARDLDAIPLPAYHAVDFSRYTSFAVVTGRGCPFNCAFCDVGPLWGNRVFLRGVENVIGELTLLRKTYGVERVSFADDTFTLQRGRTEALLKEIEPLALKWSCLTRVDAVDEALISGMATAGCDALFFGIESGSNDVLARINKKFTIQEATEKVEMAARHMKQIITSYIWGFPFETVDDFKCTIFSVVSMWHLGAMAGLKLLSPMPLSRLGIEYRDQIEFSERLCSVFASLGNITPGMADKRAEIPEEFIRAIRDHPDIFEGFYHIKSDTLGEKASYLEKFCKKFGIAV